MNQNRVFNERREFNSADYLTLQRRREQVRGFWLVLMKPAVKKYLQSPQVIKYLQAWGSQYVRSSRRRAE